MPGSAYERIMTRPTTDDVRAMLVGGERADVEFKTSLADGRRLVETIAAMATSGGGTILVGVRDDGRPVGVSVGRGEIERLVQQVLAQTDPRSTSTSTR
jgi:predicted HTH transcriptional regulator